MWCIVNLPNGTQQAVKWDQKAIGQECLEKVCKALGIICEMEYFGLEHWIPNQEEPRTRQWINLRNRLSCDSSTSSGIQLTLALRVKFWVPVHFILQESVRNLFYMQAKVDLLEGRLNARDWTNAAKLSALLCQAEGIRFNELSLKSVCPIRLRKERELLNQQKQAQLQLHKDKKDKEYVLSFKKRRLSKQKSVESIDNASHSNSASQVPGVATFAFNSSSTAQTAVSSLYLNNCASLDDCATTSPLRIYENFIVRPANTSSTDIPEDYLREIAVEHRKLSMLKMTAKSAKYWLLQEIQELNGYGEEVFTGFTTNENSARCDIAVGAHGITVTIGEDKNIIPFSAIAAAKSFRRTFKLEYVNDHNDRKDIEIKLAKHAIAAGLYRSITERHAFYVCDKVRGVVTNQFTRDLKGTIASMFKEDTELGKRYVFDIQHTCREVHDQARRILHERGITTGSNYDETMQYLSKSATLGLVASAGTNDVSASSDDNGSENSSDIEVGVASCSRLNMVVNGSMAGRLDLVIREKEEREAVIEHCVETRISEAMTCKICMDRTINTMFSPCCHVISCMQCATRCTNCPNCRVKITSASKIYLPPELRTSQSSSSSTNISSDQHDNTNTSIINALLNSNTTQNPIIVAKTTADS